MSDHREIQDLKYRIKVLQEYIEAILKKTHLFDNLLSNFKEEIKMCERMESLNDD